MILARFLLPLDFGVMGIALLAIAALETFSQTGFSAALIQKKESSEEYLDTAWTVSVLRGVILFAGLAAAAPLVARFFESPAARPVLQLIATAMLFRGSANIAVVYFLKELDFR